MEQEMDEKSLRIIREGKKTQVRDLFNSNISAVFKGTLPATVIEKFIKSVDSVYYGDVEGE